MIRAYTTNEAHTDAITKACELKSYDVEFAGSINAKDLENSLDDLNVLVFDLTGAAFSVEKVVGVLDSVDSERLPPVLYLLASPADIELITQAGSIVNQDYSFVPIEPNGLAARLEVLTILGARRKLTMESAITDRLTGLYNRKYFLRRLEEELYRSARYGYCVGVMLAEVDFEAEEGELSEDSSTVVIRKIGEFFRERLRKSDIIARYKWDDFALLLPDIAREDSPLVAQDVKVKLQAMPIRVDGVKIKLDVSVGHICFPVEGLASAVDVVATLEDCCFKAKTDGTGLASYSAPADTAQ